jgi:glucose-1-phosphate cytidylyltransferase
MKVVLFCGGLGTRLKEYSETVPKPMVDIGYRPLMWHLMRYYAHFGHKEFILCLGYKGDVIKKYFLEYNECLSNDFVLSKGGKEVQLFNNDIEDWTISFVDTGLQSNIGQRLMAVRKYLEGDDVFMANYSDGLTDLDLNLYLDNFHKQDKVASFLCVRPSQSFHIISLGENGWVKNIEPVEKSDIWINGGFFVFKKEIFDYMQPGEELVIEPFQRLIARQQITAYRYGGFWTCVDTLKDKKFLEDFYARGETPWAVWEPGNRERENKILSQNNGSKQVGSFSHS